MYTTVHFITNRSEPPFLIPDASLVVEANGTTVAVLEPLTEAERQKAASDGVQEKVLANARTVHFQKVLPGRDYGITLEILNGLQEGQYVVVDPSDAVKEGVIVQIASVAPAPTTKGSPGSSK
jgi:membrane fusion protein, multidrug efflux system